MTNLRKSHPRLRDKIKKSRLRQSGFRTERACIWALVRQVLANKDKTTLLLITMIGVEDD